MPTKRLNERYLGAEMRVPMSEDGQVAAYVWPIRIVRIAGVPCGGPTVGVEVRNQEVARFDCHESRGHWHSGRYNAENPTESQQPFPEDLKLIPEQLAWAFNKIRTDADALVRAAEFTDEAEGIRDDMIATAVNTIQTHLTNQGDLRAKAIADKLIEA